MKYGKASRLGQKVVWANEWVREPTHSPKLGCLRRRLILDNVMELRLASCSPAPFLLPPKLQCIGEPVSIIDLYMLMTTEVYQHVLNQENKNLVIFPVFLSRLRPTPLPVGYSPASCDRG